MLLLLGRLLYWIAVVPEDFSVEIQCDVQWVILLLPAVPAICYCTIVLLAVDNIYLLCNGHGRVIALVL